jgi:hypothetical protein
MSKLAQIVYREAGISPNDGMNACIGELAKLASQPGERKIANG